jgi:hypothetical protein
LQFLRRRLSRLAAVSPVWRVPNRRRLGWPSRQRIRSTSSSASFISLIESDRNCPARRSSPPFGQHLGVERVLVDRRQLSRQDLVQETGHVLVSTHHCSSAWFNGPTRFNGPTGIVGDARTESVEGDQATDASPRAGRASKASIRAWSERWQPPQPPPARHRLVTSATVRAPETIAASTVRSLTALQWQMYITGPRRPNGGGGEPNRPSRTPPGVPTLTWQSGDRHPAGYPAAGDPRRSPTSRDRSAPGQPHPLRSSAPSGTPDFRYALY